MIYFNDDFEGGVIVFESFEVMLKMGDGLIFFQELEYVGLVIIFGRKYVLCIDIMYLNLNY